MGPRYTPRHSRGRVERLYRIAPDGPGSESAGTGIGRART
jgi:hypothetical protein